MHSQLAMNMLSDYKIESCIGWFLGVRFRFSYLQSHRSRLTFGSLTVWFLGPLPRQYLWLTPNITKMVMNRIANVIKKNCQFFISSSFSRLFSPNSLFFDKVFWSVVTVNEKTTNFFTSALCDAGVAVTLTCVTMPRGVLGSDERINRKGLFC